MWEHYDNSLYLRSHADRDIPFLTFSNGKNDSGIGWEQAYDFWRALQDTRQPHIFVWGQNGHGERAVMPFGGERQMRIDVRTDRSLPALREEVWTARPGGARTKAPPRDSPISTLDLGHQGFSR